MHSSIHQVRHYAFHAAPAAGLLALLCLAAALLQAGVPTLQIALPGLGASLRPMQDLPTLEGVPTSLLSAESTLRGPGLWAGCIALSLDALRQGGWWRLICYPAVHASAWHWALAAAGLYSAGHAIESIIGSRHVLFASLLGVIWGGMAHCLAGRAGMISPSQLLVGALPACCALLGIYATVLPGWPPGGSPRRLGRWRPAARDAGWAAVACLAFWWASGWFPEAGPAAMLGALISGWAYTRILGFGSNLFYHKLIQERAKNERRIEQMNWDEFMSSELDPILEKIALHGLRSLTRKERAVLQQSRRKLEGW